jgi:hypothetical protein
MSSRIMMINNDLGRHSKSIPNPRTIPLSNWVQTPARNSASCDFFRWLFRANTLLVYGFDVDGNWAVFCHQTDEFGNALAVSLSSKYKSDFFHAPMYDEMVHLWTYSI